MTNAVTNELRKIMSTVEVYEQRVTERCAQIEGVFREIDERVGAQVDALENLAEALNGVAESARADSGVDLIDAVDVDIAALDELVRAHAEACTGRSGEVSAAGEDCNARVTLGIDGVRSDSDATADALSEHGERVVEHSAQMMAQLPVFETAFDRHRTVYADVLQQETSRVDTLQSRVRDVHESLESALSHYRSDQTASLERLATSQADDLNAEGSSARSDGKESFSAAALSAVSVLNGAAQGSTQRAIEVTDQLQPAIDTLESVAPALRTIRDMLA